MEDAVLTLREALTATEKVVVTLVPQVARRIALSGTRALLELTLQLASCGHSFRLSMVAVPAMCLREARRT